MNVLHNIGRGALDFSPSGYEQAERPRKEE